MLYLPSQGETFNFSYISIHAAVPIFIPFVLTYELHVTLPVPVLEPHLSKLPWAAEGQKCSNWKITRSQVKAAGAEAPDSD